MIKSQRRFSRVSKNESVRKMMHNAIEVEEVYCKTRRLQPAHFGDKNKTNRCTFIKPSYKDFGQFTEILQSPNTIKNAFREHFGLSPGIPATIDKLNEFNKILCQSDTKIENTSQYGTPKGISKVNIDDSMEETQWQNVESTADLYKFIPMRRVKTVPSREIKIAPSIEAKIMQSRELKIVPSKEVETMPTRQVKIVASREKKSMLPRREVKNVPSREVKFKSKEVKIIASREDNMPSREVKDAEVQNEQTNAPAVPFPTSIRISELPRIKVIAEKFSMFKRNHIELRRLEEKVVCLEYDIFDQDAETEKPFQRMRAFFSIKPTKGREGDNDEITMIPSDVKRDFDIVEEDLTKLNKREIEIIDDNLPENRSLLEDLKKVLRRNQVLRHKKEGSLDLMYLYEMAKRQNLPLVEDYMQNNVLSTDELEEIKEMILKKSVSSVHGISRRKIKSRIPAQRNAKDSEACVISNSLFMELMREVKIDTNTAKIL